MTILGKVFDRLTLLSLRVTYRELRATRRVLEIWVDTYREVHGLPPAFGKSLAPPEEETPVQRRAHVLGFGDYQSVAMIQELCEEHRIPYDLDTDFETLALDQGWLNPEGQFLILPESAKSAGRY